MLRYLQCIFLPISGFRVCDIEIRSHLACLFCIFVRNTIYVIKIEIFELVVLAPIKRPLSRKNTSPSQKMISFFCRVSLQIGMRPFCLSAPEFSIVMVWTFRRSATRHPSGSRPSKEKIKIDGCEAERSSLSRRETTILFLCGPWSVKRTPEKHRYLVMSNGF